MGSSLCLAVWIARDGSEWRLFGGHLAAHCLRQTVCLPAKLCRPPASSLMGPKMHPVCGARAGHHAIFFTITGDCTEPLSGMGLLISLHNWHPAERALTTVDQTVVKVQLTTFLFHLPACSLHRVLLCHILLSPLCSNQSRRGKMSSLWHNAGQAVQQQQQYQ